MNNVIEQAKKDFDNEVIVCRDTIRQVLNFALKYNQIDPTKWTMFHNGQFVVGETIMNAALAAQSLRTEDEKIIAAQNLFKGIEAMQSEPVSWEEAQRVCDIPAIHDALKDFSQDSTNDNAVCLIKLILEI